jgi:hypothetical protein
MDDREMALLPERLERSERRVQTEETVEIEYRLLWNVDAGAHGVVVLLAVRDDDIEAVGGATLKNYDEALGASGTVGCAECGPGEEAWDRGGADHGESAVAEEDATSGGHS